MASSMKDDPMIHCRARINDSTRETRSSATAMAIDTSVSDTWIAEYSTLSSGDADHAHVRAHQATKRHIVVGKRRSFKERPETRKSTTKNARRISMGTSEPMSPKIPRTPFPAKPTKNMPATV